MEDIAVHCLVNCETAGYKDQCTGGSGATEEAGGKRRRLTGKTVLQCILKQLCAKGLLIAWMHTQPSGWIQLAEEGCITSLMK